MRGVSREASASVHEYLETVLASGADPTVLGQELFAVVDLLAGTPALRRALTDPSRSAAARVGLVEQLLSGKVGGAAVKVAVALVTVRWAAAGDLTAATESLAVAALLAAAEQAGRLEQVEDELFRFARIVAGDPGLRDAFSSRAEGADRKIELVRALIGGKSAAETVVLAGQAAAHPRGLRTEAVLESLVEAAAVRRRRLIAQVVSARPLTETQRDRLAAALSAAYGRAIQVNADVDPRLIGGLRVHVGGELIDASVASRLADAQRRIAS
jgi:F-type H+-transporting ATPase subunit delta